MTALPERSPDEDWRENTVDPMSLEAAASSLHDLLDRETEQKERLAALLTVSQAMVSSLELDTILSTIAQQVRKVIQVDECTVFLIEDADRTLRPVACDVQAYRDEVMALRLKMGEGITGGVASTGRGEIVNKAEDDPRAMDVPGTPEEVSSLLCVPLFARDQVIGVITLVRIGPERRFFVEGDLELATLFAAQCSAAITNARMYEQIKLAYEELRATQNQLVQSAKLNALGEMAGGVAHDFNNILAAILGRTQLLLRAAQEGEIRRQLQVIEQAALDGASTVRRVQEFTRLRQDEDFEPIDVNQVIRDVIEFTRPAWQTNAKKRGVSVEIRQFLEATQPIAGNGSELREVFTNLVLNALDAMPWGGLILLTTQDADSGVMARVRDTGIGMDAETQVRVFDPFFTTKPVKGTGLGLSVAYGIVTRHHGSITVDSQPGLGTEFTLRFPCNPVSVAASRGGDPSSAGIPAMSILVVDDEEPVLEVLADMLRDRGQNVRLALGGEAGLAEFQRRPPQVVFSDLGMPEVNGWDVARRVKAQAPEIPIVLVTGWGSQLEEGSAQARGVDLIIAKPFSMEDVDRALRHVGDMISGRVRG
ncbi:MAG TPA: ATP-binding protein [Candidatus Eisenbacteria bacterium]|nr:ATP-binding protein [Candidatus Eisenbacteria bacterium]